MKTTQHMKLRVLENHKLGADELAPFGPAPLKALERIETELHAGVGKKVGDKKARKHAAERRAAEATHIEASRSELDGRMKAVLGNTLLPKEPEELAAEAAAAAALAAAADFAAERARKASKTLGFKIGNREIAVPIGKLQMKLADKLAAARAALKADGSAENAPLAGGGALAVPRSDTLAGTSPLPAAPNSKPKRRTSFNSVMLALHARITPPLAHLDPKTKLPKIFRDLNAQDEPPADAAQQSAKALSDWEAKNKARLLNMHQQLTNVSTRTHTRSRVAAESKRDIALPTPIFVESTEPVVESSKSTTQVPGTVER
jgi:hypothetical protein